MVLVCVAATLASEWTIGIPQAHFAQGFGFQNLFCWLAVISALSAVVVQDRRGAVAFLLFGEAALLVWFGWAMWVVTSPPFARLPWPFVGIDVVGAGWYTAALAMLVAAAVVAPPLTNREASGGPQVWLLAALPGYGLIRLDRWGRGLIWTTLFASALLLASYSSPDMSLFEQFRTYASLPPAPVTRSPTWILLAAALVVWAFSVIDTARFARHASPRGGPDRLPNPHGVHGHVDVPHAEV
jgi:hypothetical protein